jgi:hypothetical protein
MPSCLFEEERRLDNLFAEASVVSSSLITIRAYVSAIQYRRVGTVPKVVPATRDAVV